VLPNNQENVQLKHTNFGVVVDSQIKHL